MSDAVNRDAIVGFLNVYREELAAFETDLNAFLEDADFELLQAAILWANDTKLQADVFGLAALFQMAWHLGQALEHTLSIDEEQRANVVGQLRQFGKIVESHVDSLLEEKADDKADLASALTCHRRIFDLPEAEDAEAISLVLTCLPEPKAEDAHETKSDVEDGLSASRDIGIREDDKKSVTEKTVVAQIGQPDVSSNQSEEVSDESQEDLPAVESDFDVEMIDMDQLDAFAIEAEDHLQTAALQLTEYAKNTDDLEPLSETRRHVHSLKGAASTIGLNEVAHLAHRLEDLLQRVVEGEVAASDNVTQLAQSTVDTLEGLVGGLLGPESCSDLYNCFDELLGDHFQPTQEDEQSETSSDANAASGVDRSSVERDSESVDLNSNNVEDNDVQDNDEVEVASAQAFVLPASQIAELTQDIEDRGEIASELIAIFNEEAEDHLRIIYACFTKLEKDFGDRETIQSVRRSAHTLKGAAGAVGLRAVTQLAHRMEDLLDRLYEGGLALNQPLLTLLYTTTDALQDLVNNQGDQEALVASVTALYSEYAFRLSTHPLALTGTLEEAEAAADCTETTAEVETTVTLSEADLVAEDVELSSTEVSEVSQANTDVPSDVSIDEVDSTDGNQGDVEPEIPTFEVAPLKVNMASSSDAAEAQPLKAKKQKREEPQVGQVLRVPIDRLDNLVRMVGEMIINRTAFEQRMTDYVHFVEEMQLSIERLQNVSGELETKYAVTALGGNRIAGGDGVSLTGGLSVLRSRMEEFDDLEFDRYTEFHLLSRSLQEATTDLSTVGHELHTLIGDFDQLLTRQGRLARDTQDRLMRIRMVPLATLATRLHRTVRVVANQQGKQIDLEIRGEHVELDKFVLEEMADPLLHLLRNAADHGIEFSDERSKAGKSERANIQVEAFYQGTQVVVQVTDDGRGMNLDAIRELAVEHKLVAAADVENLSEEELLQFIFLPGFTTAKELSEVSGRGVGMDIVRDKVNKLKGTVTVASKPGEGTTFTIRLPMTLAVARALLINSRQESFAVPMQAVQQILRVERDKIDKLGSEPIIRVNGRTVPLFDLGDQLKLSKPTDEAQSMVPVLVIQSGGKQVGLIVDRILSGRDVVVKTLGNHLRHVDGLIGATLMGDGTVVPILDVAFLVESEQVAPTASATNSSRKRRSSGDAYNVMVVDDSVSVRRVMTNQLKNAGWATIDAKDGVDALEVLQTSDRIPDIFLLDIEMPRMDGYELLGALRSQEQFRDTPVVMVTSRAGQKHRTKALELGATDYVVKPYQDEALLALIREHVEASRSVVDTIV